MAQVDLVYNTPAKRKPNLSPTETKADGEFATSHLRMAASRIMLVNLGPRAADCPRKGRMAFPSSSCPRGLKGFRVARTAIRLNKKAHNRERGSMPTNLIAGKGFDWYSSLSLSR